MPKLLFARAPQDEKEEQQIRKLAGSRHAPADWILRARMIVGSWKRKRTTTIARELGCHPQTVRERIIRFNAEGIDGLGDRPGAGRKPRLTEEERGRIIALARSTPPGKAVRMGDELEAVEPEKDGGVWTPWREQRMRKAFRWNGVRFGASCSRRGSAGGIHAAGRKARTRSLSQKGEDRLSLHRATGGSDDPLPRRTRPGESAHLPACAWLVTGWTPDQGAVGLRAWTRQGLGLRCLASL